MVPSLDKKEVRKGHVVSLDKQVPAVVGRLDSTGVFQKGVVVKIGGFYDELPCLVTARVVCAECIPEESERYSVRVLLAPVRNGEYDPNGPHYQVILKDRTHLRFRLHLQPDQQKPVVSKQRLEETRPIP